MEELTLFVLAESEEFDLDVDNNLLEKKLFEKNSIVLSLYLNKKINKRFAILISGVGKVNAAFSLTNSFTILKDNNFIVSKIINLGPAGSLKLDKIGETYLIDKAYYFDVDLTAIPNYKIGQLPNNQYEFQTSLTLNSQINISLGLNIKSKNILSADRFFNQKDINNIETNFNNISLLDMESTSLIHCANNLGIEISSLKIVSDLLNQKENFYLTKKEVLKSKVTEILELLIRGL